MLQYNVVTDWNVFLFSWYTSVNVDIGNVPRVNVLFSATTEVVNND